MDSDGSIEQSIIKLGIKSIREETQLNEKRDLFCPCSLLSYRSPLFKWVNFKMIQKRMKTDFWGV